MLDSGILGRKFENNIAVVEINVLKFFWLKKNCERKIMPKFGKCLMLYLGIFDLEYFFKKLYMM